MERLYRIKKPNWLRCYDHRQLETPVGTITVRPEELLHRVEWQDSGDLIGLCKTLDEGIELAEAMYERFVLRWLDSKMYD